jgi:hypothetical protein
MIKLVSEYVEDSQLIGQQEGTQDSFLEMLLGVGSVDDQSTLAVDEFVDEEELFAVETTVDVATVDVATVDGATVDGATVDVATVDVATADVATVVGATVDVTTVDVATVDVATLDVATVEVAGGTTIVTPGTM